MGERRAAEASCAQSDEQEQGTRSAYGEARQLSQSAALLVTQVAKATVPGSRRRQRSFHGKYVQRPTTHMQVRLV